MRGHFHATQHWLHSRARKNCAPHSRKAELVTSQTDSRPTLHKVAPENKKSLRPLIARMHFFAGIFIAPLIMLATLTGIAYGAAPAIERIVYNTELYSASRDISTPLAAQVDTAIAKYPNLKIASVDVRAAGENTRVNFQDPSLQRGYTRTVFVDPSTGVIAGEHTMYRGKMPFRQWLSTFHKSLNIGKGDSTTFTLAGTEFTLDPIGALYSETAAGWLLVMLLGGIYLWLSAVKTRKDDGENISAWTAEKSATGHRRTRSWHAVLGVWFGIGILP